MAVVSGLVLSVVAIALEELTFRRYPRMKDVLQLLWLSVVENVVFRPVLTYYRFRGTISYFRGETDWGTMERKGFAGQHVEQA